MCVMVVRHVDVCGERRGSDVGVARVGGGVRETCGLKESGEKGGDERGVKKVGRGGELGRGG